MPEGAAVLFVDASGRVLLRKRDDRPGLPFPGQWDLVGGAVEEGEAPQQTAKREVAEEIGLELGPVTYFGEFMGVVVNHVFLSALNTPAEEIILREGQRLGWFATEDAMQLDLVPWVRDLLIAFTKQPFGSR